MVEIGQREGGVGRRYVSRMIRLAFLAPAIVESIAEGRQPPELTAQFLIDRSRRSSAQLASPRKSCSASQNQLDRSAVQEILPELFLYFRFQVIDSANFCATAESPKSTAKTAYGEKARRSRRAASNFRP